MLSESNAPRWEKLGLIFRPDNSKWWTQSHASPPVPVRLNNGLVRVFFASRDERQRSHVGWFDVDLDDPSQSIASASEPVLYPGSAGLFDGDGIYPSSVALTDAGDLRLYTIGWNVGAPAPMFYSAIGAAESSDGGATFVKVSAAPLMSRSEHDPCLVTAPVVLRDKDLWRMWYVSGKSWTASEKGLQSHYDVKYAWSHDGLSWVRDGHTCLAAREPEETNISRFWVIEESGVFHAFFGFHRGDGYRIGYARSDDGKIWNRDDVRSGIACSENGWDSEAISYPAVIRHDNRWFMFYNGNGFGRDGVGLAVSDPFL